MIDALVRLARPRLLPFVLLLPGVGYGWAHWDRAMTARGGGELLAVLASWTLLHAGTLWLNAWLDRDEGEVLLGEAVPPPDGTPVAARFALAACVLTAASANPVAGVCAALGWFLAEAYSHPTVALKGHALGGPAVNVVGYGVLSPLAGWSAAGVPLNARTVAFVGVVALGVLGAYFVAQVFQADEDRARGYRTLVARAGPRAAVDAARASWAAGAAVAATLAVVGWWPPALLLALPGLAWVDRWMRAWRDRPGGGTAADATEAARRLAWVALAVVLLAGVDYAVAIRAGGPVAGLATPAGRPHDRPAVPPRDVTLWEAGLLHCALPDGPCRPARAAVMRPAGRGTPPTRSSE